MEEPIVMKKIIALAVIGVTSQTIVAFAGPEVPSKAVVTPPPVKRFQHNNTTFSRLAC
jgi:hypothetical protein